MLLPRTIRAAIWAAYVPGQEESLNPSDAWQAAHRKAQGWVKAWKVANS